MTATAPIRLIAMDLDGTLLAPHRPGERARISEGCLRALWAAHERGITLCLASGRLPDDAAHFAMAAGLPMRVLALNGACALDEPRGELLSGRTVSPAAAHRLWELACACPADCGLFGGHELVLSTPIRPDNALWRWGSYLDAPDGRSAIRVGREAGEALCEKGVHKLVAISPDRPDVLETLTRQILRELPELKVSTSWRDNIEVDLRDVDKGTALRDLAARLRIPMEQVMAIGDNGNDLPMLRAVGWSVAMGNATDEVKACCGWHTLSDAEDGVAAAIWTLALGRPVPGVTAR